MRVGEYFCTKREGEEDDMQDNNAWINSWGMNHITCETPGAPPGTYDAQFLIKEKGGSVLD
jgi:hypothetical protein